ncbi:MAG: sigma-70 family RNA polymerase sigma factor [Deltaproteobacteria bacterium]|nr:sigma-70 family RNA polymerase sigma factor [Deltaproteobacteria bacterium]
MKTHAAAADNFFAAACIQTRSAVEGGVVSVLSTEPAMALRQPREVLPPRGPAMKARPAEVALLPRVARGDIAAVKECIKRYSPLVASMARRFFSNEADADDATQDVFLELWRCAERFDEREASEAAFVVMLARRRFIDRARSIKRAPPTVDVEALSLAAPSSSFEDHADARVAMRVLDTLVPDQKNAVLLSAVHGLAHQEIADELDIPLGTVKSHIRRSLSLLRKALFGEQAQDDETP